MSHPLAHQAETLRLARVLGVDACELAFLANAPFEDLATVRAAVLDRLLDRSRSEFERAVALANKIPRGLAATLAQHAMGPVLGGRAAALLSADMAADLARRLPADFLADVATHVDLRHVGPLISGIPTDTMAAAGRVLREREEWIVLSAFVGHVPDDKLEILLNQFDGEALLRAGFVIEDPSRLDTAIRLLPDARLDELFLTAHEHALWPEAMSLATHIGPEQARRIVAAIDEQPDDHLDALLEAASEHGLWREAITVASHAGDDGPAGGAILGAIARLPAERLDALLAATHEHELWPEVIAVASRLGEDGHGSDAILGAIDRLSPDRADALLEVAHARGLWQEILLVVARTRATDSRTIADAVGRLPTEHIHELLIAADASDLWRELVSLAVAFGGEGEHVIVTAIERLPSTQQEKIAAVLIANPDLRASAGVFITRAPAHLRAVLAAAPQP